MKGRINGSEAEPEPSVVREMLSGPVLQPSNGHTVGQRGGAGDELGVRRAERARVRLRGEKKEK